MQSWNDKVVVITGGTAGIGKALALASQKAGAKTVVIARKPDGLKALEEQSLLVLVYGCFKRICYYKVSS